MRDTGRRDAGLLLPAFTPRREGDLGIGDTRALIEWIDWAADHEVGFLQLLPIHETGSDHSPYNAISSIALEPAYLSFDVGEIPCLGLSDLGAARGALNGSGLGTRVDYDAVKRVKRGLLEVAWPRFLALDVGERAEFEAFCREEAEWLDDYCLFRWLMERHGGSEEWTAWRDGCQEVGGARALLAAERERDPLAVDFRLGYFAFVQWLCFRQWRRVRVRADERGVALMGDLPIGVSYCSADVFFGREDFDLAWCGGAPPETMFKHDRFIRRWGQNWGIPLYRWDKMEREGYPWWKRRVRRTAELFHRFRIDHILGFYRIYSFPWRPSRNDEFLELDEAAAAALTGGPLPRWADHPDEDEAGRAANLAAGDRRLRAVLEAAGGAAVIGEDLGCLPDYVRPHLESLGIAGFRIPHWDVTERDRVVPGSLLPECSFTTYATHDHDPIAAIWTSSCRLANHHHGHPAGEGPDPGDALDAARTLRLLGEFANISPHGSGAWPEFGETIQWRLIKALLESSPRHAALMIQDLFRMEERINRPGTVGPENWSLRLPFTASEARVEPALAAQGTRLATLLRLSGRGRVVESENPEFSPSGTG